MEEELKKLPLLSKIHCSESEQKDLIASLVSILEYMKQLDEIDVSDIPPCDHVLAGVSNVLREDEVGKSEKNELLQQKKFLENSPSHVGGMIKVPSVIKF